MRDYILVVDHGGKNQDLLKSLLQDHGFRTFTVPLESTINESVFLKQYHAAMIRNLEDQLAELEATNEALRKSEERYQLITDHMADTIWIMDLNRRFTYISPSVMRLRGFTVEEAMEQRLEQVLTPESLKVALSAFEEETELEVQGTADPGRTRTIELEEYRKDGSTVWVDNSLSFLRDKNNRAMAILGVTRDITDRKRAEKEKAELQKQIQQAQKMEAIGRLAGGIAHDFNNLLSVILGYGEIMMNDLPLSHPHHELLTEICDAGMRARNLTRQLLVFSRNQSLEIKLVDINALVTGFEKMIRRIIGEDIRLDLALTPQKTIVKADRCHLEQVLMNLAVNARDAMADGGVLTIETVVVEPDESCAMNGRNDIAGRHVMISITDTGAGMTREILDHIFEPFFTTKCYEQGTGLGLATTYGIVQNHGGTIRVYSEPGEGTTFKICLPPAAGECIPESEPVSGMASANATATILVVEDDPGVRKIVCSILETKGYDVINAGVPEEAVEIAQNCTTPIHLLLSDIVMPGMKGPKVHEHISRFHPGIKVLYMSGYSENSIMRYGIDISTAAFIQKPLTVRSLLEKVASMLAEH